MKDTPESLLTQKEVMRYFGITRSTLWRWRKAHILTPCKIGHIIRFRKSELYRLINTH